MSISSNRIKYLDKENKVLVKDFKTLLSNAIFTDFIAPLLDMAALESIAAAYSELSDLANGLTSLYNQITDPKLVSGIVDKVLSSLNVHDPRLASVAVLITAIKTDVSGLKEKFLVATMNRTAMSVFDNPSLLHNYSGVTSDTATLVTLAALNQMSNDLAKNNFNYTKLAESLGSDLKTTNATTDLVDNNQKVISTLLAINKANPSSSNPVLNLEPGVTSLIASDAEFVVMRSMITAFHIYKIETYKIYLDALVDSSGLANEMLLPTFDAASRGTAIANYHLNVKTYQDYGIRHLATLLRTTALYITERTVATSQQQYIGTAYTNFIALVAKVKTEGLVAHVSYTELVDAFNSNFKNSSDPLAVYKINLNHEGALSNAVTVMRSMYDNLYSTTSTVVVDKDMIPLYMLVYLSESLDSLYPSPSTTTVTDADRIVHLQLLSKVVMTYYNDIDTRVSYDSAVHTDYFHNLPSLIQHGLDCGILDKIPTAVQAASYGNPNVGTVWSYVRAKYKALTAVPDILETILTPVVGSVYAMTPQLTQAYNLFELPSDYDKSLTDSFLGLIVPLINRRDAVRRVIINPDCTTLSVTG